MVSRRARPRCSSSRGEAQHRQGIPGSCWRRAMALAPANRYSMVPINPVTNPAACRIESTRYEVVVLPLVPVIPVNKTRCSSGRAQQPAYGEGQRVASVLHFDPRCEPLLNIGGFAWVLADDSATRLGQRHPARTCVRRRAILQKQKTRNLSPRGASHTRARQSRWKPARAIAHHGALRHPAPGLNSFSVGQFSRPGQFSYPRHKPYFISQIEPEPARPAEEWIPPADTGRAPPQAPARPASPLVSPLPKTLRGRP